MKTSKSHWLIAQHAFEMHAFAVPNTSQIACGVDLRWPDGSYVPNDRVTCPECRATSRFQETLITIELAFNGNAHEWWAAEKKQLPKVKGP